ncbi:MAG: 30S ribosome-binding factor RbfA [Opitutaceae bacterium]|nr:30S ribosome-binding factor RbfA [Opitutaceae bacterium]MBP9913146.1 30S ribosome-binding factor RbfA [Opitutaceae bacterium]
MSNRTLRVNELLQREISDILRKRYQSDAVTITITEVRVAPDLRDARVFVSVVGEAETTEQKMRWLRSRAPEIRAEISRRIVLKYLPKFQYVLDKSVVSSTRLLGLLDELKTEEDPEAEASDTEPKDE